MLLRRRPTPAAEREKTLVSQQQGTWKSQNVCYQDPRYGADIRVQLAGEYLATVTAGPAGRDVGAEIGAAATPALTGILSTLPMDQLANEREQIAGRLAQAIGPVLAQSGIQLAGIRVTGEVWNNRSVLEDFSRKAGPVLLVAGGASIVLALAGLNLKILLWVDAWGPTVGWLIRMGVVGLGLAFLGIGRALNKD